MFSAEPTPGMLRIYRRNTSERVFILIFTTASAAFCLGIWYRRLAGTGEVTFLDMVGSVCFFLFGVLLTVAAFRRSICLTCDSIRFQGIIATAVLPYERIKGRRKYLDKGYGEGGPVWHFVLEPNDDCFPRLDFEEAYQFDYFFYCWFDTLPDLDAFDKAAPEPSNFGLV
jgi:hypothetical protein